MAFSYLQSQLAFKAAGQYAQVVTYWGIEDPTEDNKFRLARDFVLKMETEPVAGPIFTKMLPMMSNDTYISSSKARVVSDGGGANYIRAYAAGTWPGSNESHLAAQQVATHIKWVTTGHDGAHGGSFFPGVAEISLDNNRFTDAMKDNITAFVTAWIAGFEGDSGEFFPVLRHKNGAVYEFLPIVGGQVSTTAGTQRRRLTPV